MTFLRVSTLRNELHTIYFNTLNKKVLDSKGFVKIIDCMPRVIPNEARSLMCDSAVVQAARVSYGEGLKDFNTDTKLINYLYKNKHTSPFEMVKFKFHIKAPIFVARQWFRHRMGNYNEISGRYSKLNSEFYVPNNLYSQSKDNKQLSDLNINLLENEEIKNIFLEYINNNDKQYSLYNKLIDLGVSREIARIGLPQNLYTEFYWSIDLHNLFNFIRLRDSNNAQGEIKEYAKTIKKLVKVLCPISMDAYDTFTNLNLSKNQIESLQFKTDNLKESEIKELKKLGLRKCEFIPFLL